MVDIHPHITYRPCQPADVDAVLDLWRRAEAIPGPTDDPAAIAVRLQRDTDLFLLALHDCRIVGCLIGGWDGWRGIMYRLAVDPDYRRLGVAEHLVRQVEADMRALGARRITSLVFRDESPSVHFWAAQGYHHDTAIDRYAKDLDA